MASVTAPADPIDPPVKPMLAKLMGRVLDGSGWLFEPKWDGFRAIVFRGGDSPDAPASSPPARFDGYRQRGSPGCLR